MKPPSAAAIIDDRLQLNAIRQVAVMTKPYAEIAVAFATALVDGDWVGAHALLDRKLRGDLSPSILQERFRQMFQDYATGVPASVHFDDQFAMDEWPAKQTGDVGWAYVSILGESVVEAVTVVVSNSEGPLLIRSIEWGRP